MNIQSPFHYGELHVQQRANESHIAQRNGGVISDTILSGAIPFIAQQKMLVLSSLDQQGNIWTSVLLGNPGFIQAPDPRSLLLDTREMIKCADDPLWRNIQHNPKVGLLIIELASRRRLRVNGHIQRIDDSGFSIQVEQSYPNCPKYIQRRSLQLTPAALQQSTEPSSSGKMLDQELATLIETADSFFVGTASSATANTDSTTTDTTATAVDSSYRGGHSGFIEIIDNSCLRIPDYRGNSMFNTLGNIHSNAKAGISFIDFKRGQLLQLSGAAKILWEQQDSEDKTAGTQRFWELSIEQWRLTPLPKGLNWEFLDYSPHNLKHSVPDLNLSVESIERKSPRVKLFRLVSTNGALLPAFEPGSHLPVEVDVVVLAKGKEERDTPKDAKYKAVQRHYSLLSSSHDNRYYEIAVQQEPQGRGGSNYMHRLQVGDTITAKAPRSEFPLLAKAKHSILIAGGIGITPILSMLRHLSESAASFEIHYTARSEADLAFKQEIKALAGDKAFFYHSRGEGSQRLNLGILLKQPQSDTEVYLCGPVRMIAALREVGERNAWPADRLHFESFGSSTLATDSAITLILKKSAQVIEVKPTESILDALINAKISVPYECKRGECGMCATPVLAGSPDHRDLYLTKDEQKQQICVCVSRSKGKTLSLDL
tara:strand:+ start:7398 stop:9365 length:1968 start_codon:yes stop_codon:yes gene_type:complete